MIFDKSSKTGIPKIGNPESAGIKIVPSQDVMLKSLCETMCKNAKIDKKVFSGHLNRAIAEWQTITQRPLRDEVKMVPIERIRISRTIFKILRDNLSQDFKGKKDGDQINKALDITLKYYEDNYAYR